MVQVIETVAEMTLTPQEIENLFEEVESYHQIYNSLFERREQRERSKIYLCGLLDAEIENKAIEPMVLAMRGDNANEIRAQQHFVSAGAWADGAILAQHWREVAVDLGNADGVFTTDGSDFPKQGQESAGVKRQYCGELGKVANCQAGVFLGYASEKGHTLLDRRLYLPEEWIEEEEYAARREKCGIPEGITFKTKPQLAVEMLKAVLETGVLPGRWLTCDEAFGRSTLFLDDVARLGIWYYAEVPHDTQVWLERPQTGVAVWSGRGRRPTREQVVAGEPTPETVSAIAESLPAVSWTRQIIKEGSKGPLVAEFAFIRVVEVRDDLPGADVWLILRRNPTSGELKTYVSNAPEEIAQAALVRMSGMRWPIETTFEDGKQLIGMGDYQVRSWVGWHHHMTMCILAHFFLIRLRLRLGDTAPALTLPQARLLLLGVLPKREFDAEWVLEVLRYRQRRNHAAYLSHRKRRLNILGQSDGEISL
jgi:SRSO17 transposase